MMQSMPAWQSARFASNAREKGRFQTWHFLKTNPARSTYARAAFEHECQPDEVLGTTAVIVAHKSEHPTGRVLIEQFCIRGSSALTDFVRQNQTEALAFALFDLATIISELAPDQGFVFDAGRFTVHEGRVTPLAHHDLLESKRRTL